MVNRPVGGMLRLADFEWQGSHAQSITSPLITCRLKSTDAPPRWIGRTHLHILEVTNSNRFERDSVAPSTRAR